MKIHIFHHPDKETAEQLCRMEKLLSEYWELTMSTFEELKAAQEATDAKLDALIAKLAAAPPPGLTPEEQQAIDDAVAHQNAINGKIDTI